MLIGSFIISGLVKQSFEIEIYNNNNLCTNIIGLSPNPIRLSGESGNKFLTNPPAKTFYSVAINFLFRYNVEFFRKIPITFKNHILMQEKI